jgi:hypothetical protein
MYYRVAIQRQGDQLDRPPTWQWKSTALSSLQTLFQWQRLYGALPQDHLRVFSSASQQDLQEQLVQENKSCREGNGLVGGGMSALERRRLERELGPGGDHAVPIS